MSVQLVLLCEDEQTACFMRRFLKRRRWKSHDIREVIAPKGKGSGEQWVREQFPVELAAVRARADAALVVGTDADTMSVEDRIASLRQHCNEAGVSPPKPGERVLMIVPRRNIETWFAYLRGTEVDEDRNYPRLATESECREDVRVLDDMCQKASLRQPAPPSLTAACLEYSKL